MHFLEARRPKVEELAREQMPKLGFWELASSLENTLSVHSIFRGSQEVTGQKVGNGGLYKPNGRGRGARALLEPRCGGMEDPEYQPSLWKRKVPVQSLIECCLKLTACFDEF